MLLQEAVASQQDFEWYPTTEEIISAVAEHIKQLTHNRLNRLTCIMDVGAGDGRVLMALSSALEDEYGRRPQMLAIEKSIPLIDAMPKEIGIMGTDFHQQTLMDKKVDVLFCNPPYSEYALWMEKIVIEANAAIAYLVVPQRWKTNEQILAALKRRRAHAKVVGSFDFSNAERKARAKVDLVCVDFGRDISYHSWKEAKARQNDDPKWIDPFDAWFDAHFGREDVPEENDKPYTERERKQAEIRQKMELVKGSSLVEALEEIYQNDLKRTLDTYEKVCSLDAAVLNEMKIDMSGIKSALKSRIEGLKEVYWRELFDHLESITDRLTHRTRKSLLSKLSAHATLDFTASNAYAIVVWAIKNANEYYDQQLMEVFEEMVTKSNVEAYKSNEKTFGAENWRYIRGQEAADRFGPFKLDYRIVVERCSAIVNPNDFGSGNAVNGLHRDAADFLDDLCVVARNLGYCVSDRSASFTWSSGKANEFLFERDGVSHVLMRVKAFKNGNIHIQFDQGFIRRLNVEYGRLKGWLKSKDEAMKEMGLSAEEADDAFGCNFALPMSTARALTYQG
ncbi:DUF4942 domain-containing protein [Candidatus Parcubacteria bacterium]|nr:MAG: DUF4942 domain-containing protein [Candidatus Parcubacteria bacterium]